MGPIWVNPYGIWPEHIRLRLFDTVFPNLGMAHSDHDHDEPEPITDHTHHTSWSANLEGPQHAEDRDLVIMQAQEAVDHTASGYHVNLVTHGNHGHPSNYLYKELDATETDLDYEYIEQCGCGGHVTRVHVN